MSENSNRNSSRNEASQYRDYSRYSRGASRSNYSQQKSNLRNTKSDLNLGGNYTAGKAQFNPQSLDSQAAAYSRTGSNRYSHSYNVQNKRASRRKNIVVCIIIILVLAMVAGAVYKFYPIKVTVNNQEYQLSFNKTLGEAINNSQLIVKPGNLIAVDDSIINKGEGDEFYCEVNGAQQTDLKINLKNGDNITYGDGHDVCEEYTSIDSDIKAKATMKGTGSLHKFSGTGANGVWSKMTGKISKKYAEKQTKAPDDVVCSFYTANPGQDKVLALTFDDGPSDEYTQQILDILDKYNAKATFFVIGENIEESWGQKLIKAEDSAGHQVCTHSYDHARPAGGTDMTGMTAEKQIQEITKGQSLIAKAIGHDASSVVRLPGGNICENTIRLIAPYVTAEIGWNVDTSDWSQPGKAKIVNAIKEASSGDVILCHDGGGDRSQTVEALKEAIPYFIEKGYKFITIDEMLEYPAAVQKQATFQ